MSSHAPRNDAGVAVAENGEVMLDGPDGVAVSMTPEAADGTAESLKNAAREARIQRDRAQSGAPPSD